MALAACLTSHKCVCCDILALQTLCLCLSLFSMDGDWPHCGSMEPTAAPHIPTSSHADFRKPTIIQLSTVALFQLTASVQLRAGHLLLCPTVLGNWGIKLPIRSEGQRISRLKGDHMQQQGFVWTRETRDSLSHGPLGPVAHMLAGPCLVKVTQKVL